MNLYDLQSHQCEGPFQTQTVASSCLIFLIVPNIITIWSANVISWRMVMFNVAFNKFSGIDVSTNPCFAASIIVSRTSPTDYSPSLIGDDVTVRVIIV